MRALVATCGDRRGRKPLEVGVVNQRCSRARSRDRQIAHEITARANERRFGRELQLPLIHTPESSSTCSPPRSKSMGVLERRRDRPGS